MRKKEKTFSANLETAVIIKFITWYEELTPVERYHFEGCLGRIVKAVKLEREE